MAPFIFRESINLHNYTDSTSLDSYKSYIVYTMKHVCLDYIRESRRVRHVLMEKVTILQNKYLIYILHHEKLYKI